MIRVPNTEFSLLVTPDGRPGCARIELGAAEAGQAAIPLSKSSPVGAGPLQAISLHGQGLGSLSEVERWQLLRHCRHLLVPGGHLNMPVGTGVNEFPRGVLNDLVWLSGFESWVDFVAGCAVLTKPRREVTTDSLVSIVMPAYKDEFFTEALASAQAQTWPHCEIVVCDDGPGERIGQIARASEGPHPVRYFRNPKNLGGWANYVRCFELARGRYIKFLNDDDLLHRECVTRMATVLDERPAVTLVTGYRELIDEAGRLLPDEAWNVPLASVDIGVPGDALIGLALTKGVNQIGEPTTAMFRRADLADNQPHLMSYAGQPIPRNGDMTMWASLLSRGDAVYLSDAMSSFRQHGTQVQKDPAYQSEGMAAWFTLRKAAVRTGLPEKVSSLGPMLFNLLESRNVAAGEKLFSTGDARSALSVFAVALHQSPVNVRARGNLACAAWELGQYQQALIEGVLAHCCDPDDENIAMNLQDMMALDL